MVNSQVKIQHIQHIVLLLYCYNSDVVFVSGILADDMGLGKTLEIIALILTNFEGGKPLAVPVAGKIRPSQVSDTSLKIFIDSVRSNILSRCGIKQCWF